MLPNTLFGWLPPSPSATPKCPTVSTGPIEPDHYHTLPNPVPGVTGLNSPRRTIMGELKELRGQQESLVHRARDINHKVWLAGLGAVSKAEEQGRKSIDRYVAAGERAIGSEAALKSRYIVAARGLVTTLREEGDEILNKLVDAGKKQDATVAEDGNVYILALVGALTTLRDESRKIFDDLVASGEKRQNTQA